MWPDVPHHLFNLEETLYPHAKASREIFSISREWSVITASREANLRLTECGSATLGEFFSSCPSSKGSPRDTIHTFNNYCKCNYHLQSRLLLFIQTWSARWAGARFRIVVTADQWHAPNKEGTDLQTRGPMKAPLSNWVGFCCLVWLFVNLSLHGNSNTVMFFTEYMQSMHNHHP